MGLILMKIICGNNYASPLGRKLWWNIFRPKALPLGWDIVGFQPKIRIALINPKDLL